MISFLKRVHRPVVRVLCVMLVGALLLTGNVTLGYEVYLDGESLGAVSLFSPVIAKASENTETAYYLKIITEDTENDQNIMARLTPDMENGVRACVLYLNGVAILAVESEEVLQNILEEYRSQYGEEGLNAFNKGVTFEEKLVSPESVCSEEVAKNLLGATDENGAPLLSVLTFEESVWEENIPYETVYENTDTLTRGHTAVKVAGTEGVIRHTGYSLSANGEKFHEIRLSSETISTPTVEVVLVGTREPGKGEGTGSYVKPCNGIFSSGFGRRWGRNHNGVDFRGEVGTGIVAADSGRVVYSQWNDGGFGYMVKIDHGNGVETWYAHLSELLVKEGTIVEKGDLIARMGNTGRSTGSHLHFEIRVNEKAVNPAKYISF